MDAQKQSHGWWFDSHNSINCSPWLQSTLSDLNEKTKTMLKLVEDDADSFAQRAEMYYKKRPELISMVEDFYRAHRSLAERYDQLKCDRSVRVRSPLRRLSSIPKDEYENLFDSTSSVKSLDSFTETAYSSEIDDPELEDNYRIDQGRVEEVKENTFSAWDGSDELNKLREELDRLQEENEVQKNQINNNNREKEEIISQLEDNINDLKKLREECEAIKEEVLFIPVKLKEEVEVTMHFEEEKKNEMTKLWDEIRSLKLECKNLRELTNEKDRERIEMAKKFEEAKEKLRELEAENRCLKDAIVLKEILLKHEEEEKTKVARLFEEASIELMKLREEIATKTRYTENASLKEELLKLKEDMQRKERFLVEALAEKDEEKRAVIRQLSLAMEILREDNEILKKSMMKELMKLKEETQKKDMCLVKALAEKDEEKRAVIRQLSLAMEILREDNEHLKKSIVKGSPKKGSPFSVTDVHGCLA